MDARDKPEHDGEAERRMRAASASALRNQLARLAQGADETCGTRGSAASSEFTIDVSIRTYGRAALGWRVPSMVVRADSGGVWAGQVSPPFAAMGGLAFHHSDLH